MSWNLLKALLVTKTIAGDDQLDLGWKGGWYAVGWGWETLKDSFSRRLTSVRWQKYKMVSS